MIKAEAKHVALEVDQLWTRGQFPPPPFLMLDRGVKSTSTIQAEIVQGGDVVSLVTVKREVKEMLKKGLLLPRGSGRSRSYEVSTLAKIFIDIPASTYCEQEPDKRFGSSHFNFDLLDVRKHCHRQYKKKNLSVWSLNFHGNPHVLREIPICFLIQKN